MEPLDPADDYDDYDGLTPLGEPAEWRFRRAGGRLRSVSLLVVDPVELSDGRRLECKRLPPAVRGEGDRLLAEVQLDNEIRALVRLATRYPNQYPVELPELVGYNFDASEPFVLLRSAPSDTSVDDPGVTLLTRESRAFQVGIFRALSAMHAIDLVHGAVRLGSLRWHADRTQLVGFEHSAAQGEALRSRPVTMGSSGSPSLADAADDVRDAGVALFKRVKGRTPAPRDLSDPAAMDQVLGVALRGVFDPDPHRRPTAAQVLAALHDREPRPDPIDIDHALRDGWEAFDAKHPRPVVVVSPPVAPVPLPVTASVQPALPLRLMIGGAAGILMVIGFVVWMWLK